MLSPAGKRDRMIRFVRPQVVKDESGIEAESGDPELIEQAWAAVRYGASAERREAAGQNASQTATFRVLSTLALRAVVMTDRIVDDVEQTWDIAGSAAVGGPAAEIEFTATARKG